MPTHPGGKKPPHAASVMPAAWGTPNATAPYSPSAGRGKQPFSLSAISAPISGDCGTAVSGHSVSQEANKNAPAIWPARGEKFGCGDSIGQSAFRPLNPP